jgi:Flp pilus assembly pilin Flp
MLCPVRIIRLSRRLARNRSGATVVEFAIISVALLSFIAFLVEGSFQLLTGAMLQYGLREATRFGITGQAYPPGMSANPPASREAAITAPRSLVETHRRRLSPVMTRLVQAIATRMCRDRWPGRARPSRQGRPAALPGRCPNLSAACCNIAGHGAWSFLLRHGRPRAGHPRLAVLKQAKSWTAGPSRP